jgi:hypothetical protein
VQDLRFRANDLCADAKLTGPIRALFLSAAGDVPSRARDYLIRKVSERKQLHVFREAAYAAPMPDLARSWTRNSIRGKRDDAHPLPKRLKAGLPA